MSRPAKAVLILCLALGTMDALAEDLSDCTQPNDMPRAVGGCTGLLEAGTSSDLALAYRNRSSAHAALGDFAHADQDYQRAVALNPALVGGYIEAFDEEPLPVAVADRAHQRLLDLVASLDLRASAEGRLADLNRVAACRLWH